MIGVFVVSSNLEKQKKFGEWTKKKISNILKNIPNLKIFDIITTVESAEEISKEIKGKISGCVIVSATGGITRAIIAISKNIGKPILLWATPYQNSLASSLKAFLELKQNIPIKIFYSSLDSKALIGINSFIKVCEAIDKICTCRFGCISEPSKWILTSNEEKIIKQFGPEIVKLKMKELIDIAKRVSAEEVKDIFQKLKIGQVKVAKDKIIKAIKIYLAMKKLISKYNLSVLTIRCFDLLDYDYTACLGVSMCNDESLIAGCEADLQATLTMMIVSFLTNQPCWMANTCRINKDKNTVTLAHCTIATKMIADLSKAALLPHMESGKCVSIRGPLRKSEITLIRLGKNLDKMLIATGRIVKSDMKEPNLCRTQVEVKLKGDVEDWFLNILGNHQILVYGNFESILLDFCKLKGIEAVVIK